MPTAVITGSGGLIGSESAQRFVQAGYDVVGVENDMRARFFGSSASTSHTTARLTRTLGSSFRSLEIDIRDREAVDRLFAQLAGSIELVIHTAAQPSHDWAASDPHTDFTVNANGTLNLLQATRDHSSAATFIFCSTNKVYGDLPNYLPLVELAERLELPEGHRYFPGIDTTMSIDASTHSLFGVSKAAADLLVQEFGRYFDMPTVCFRGGCLTGPNHAGAMLHGFLSYSDAVHDDRRAIHGVRLWRQAGARQHPFGRPGVRVSGVSSGAARRRGVQHWRRPRQQLLDDRGDRDFASRSLGGNSSGRCPIGTESATTVGGSPTCRRFAATTRSGTSPTTSPRCCTEIHDHNAELWETAR